MSLDDRLSRLRDEADRDIPVPADLQPRVKTAVRAQAPRRSRPWTRFIEIAAACLILGALGAMPLLRPAKPVPGVTPPTPPVATPIATADLVALHMATETAGWAMTNSAVLHTSDGGATWQDVSPKLDTGTVRPAYFLDGETAWVQESFSTIHQQFFRTTDGGRTWQKWSVMLTGLGPRYHFIDRDHGWTMTSHGVAAGSQPVQVLQTADGGKTWATVDDTRGGVENPPGSLPFGGTKTGVGFRDANTGWAGGYQPTPGGPWFYVTHDGGHTWQEQALPLPPGYQESFVTTNPPRFFDPRSGIMLATLSTAETAHVWYRTADGGATWQPGSPIRGSNVMGWDFADASHGWVLAGPQLHITGDGGKTWAQVESNLPATDRAVIDFATPTTGWVLTNTGLFKSTDGGRTWASLQSQMAPE